jgi:hypothetical protein
MISTLLTDPWFWIGVCAGIIIFNIGRNTR